MFRNILVVCHANICRSPMAEALLRAEAGIRDAGIIVGSAGVAARAGHPADTVVASMLQERGLDVSGHRSRRLTQEMVREAQLILVMETPQLREVEMVDPSSRGKVHLLGKWEGGDIADPHRQEESVYRGSAQRIELAVANWIKKIC